MEYLDQIISIRMLASIVPTVPFLSQHEESSPLNMRAQDPELDVEN